MGTKDMAENYLEAYNDVFADIVNVLLFQGRPLVEPEQLSNATTKTVYNVVRKAHSFRCGMDSTRDF